MAERELYMCKTDFDHELGNAAGGVKVYSSLEDLAASRPCVTECGIVKVRVEVVEIVKDSAF